MKLRRHPELFCVSVAVAALVCTSISCSRKDSNIPKVVSAIKVFNLRFNAGQFHEIYASADPRFRASITESDFAMKLSDLRREHGPIHESNITGFEDLSRWQRLLPEFRPTRFIGMYSRCKEGGFQELFKFDVTGDEAKLLEFETSIEDANRKLKH